MAGAALVAALAAGGAVSATGTTVTVVAGKPTELSLRLTPKIVPAGKVVFKVENEGTKPHRFMLCSSSKGGTANSCAGKRTPVLAPGASASLAVTLAGGRFEYLDSVGRNAQGGANGVLVVKAATTRPVSAPTPTSPGSTTPSGGTTPTSGGTPVGTGSSSLGDINAGRQIFTSIGCTGCHTLAAAESIGGVDLDSLKPSLAVARDNITNGNSEGMPAWTGQLTKTQIQNVAAFVYCATNAGAAGC
jgi:cbb3-type cytochrome c oxidase subunit III